jgi:hypothetical protein
MPSWEDELRLKIDVPVEENDAAETVKAAVIAAIEKKLEEIPTDVFDRLGDDESFIVFRTVRPKGGPDPLPSQKK